MTDASAPIPVETDAHNWLQGAAEELLIRIRRHRLVFIHWSPLHGRLTEALTGALTGERIDARAFARLADQELRELRARSRVVFVIDVGRMAEQPSSGLLSQLRFNSHQIIELDGEVCFVSTLPKNRFPQVPGSSILADSASYFLSFPTPAQFGVPFEIPELERGDRQAVRALFCSALEPLSSAVLVELDRELFELGSPPSLLQHVSPAAREELRGSGLIRESAYGEFVFCADEKFHDFRAAVGEVVSSIVQPPEVLNEIVLWLFQIERVLRLKVRKESQDKHGDAWRKRILAESLKQKVLDRASLDAYPNATSVAQLRDPLEWLTLGELVDLVGSGVFNGLGKDSRFWSRFKSDVLPVRNRIGHMRIPLMSDRDVVRRWARFIDF